MSKEASKAHSVLHYIISKAVLEGKEMTSELNLSLHDLQNEFEDVNFEVDAANNIKLKVRIQTTWDTEDELMSIEDMIGDNDEDENGPTGNGESSDTDKKSH
jgi:hypothetical protein